ncbi:uncharacterized protein LOC110009525 [Jatropha curcas]|uniref:uncharacterized protein LOC110009525 n=1 Tax=Jatropha curcas TaxID=180498 RepID=UPI001895BD33|nr:uncharacterized protein LOC110009525 [Jatropha curcas]XP_037497902.1 uncharacterized protein LOC110009525 [Jatropha curcas]
MVSKPTSLPLFRNTSIAEKIHPATTITNMKRHIPLTLDYESAQYNNWATLVIIHAKATLTYDHINPKSDHVTSSPPKSSAEQAHWDRIDNIVRQWIYGTISSDLLNIIINPDDIALDAWNQLAELFQDNKTSRAIHLETKFANTNLCDFPDAKAYTRRLKVLVDQLANVGAKVSDHRMVLRLLTRLTDAYEGFVTVVQNKSSLSSFAQVRSMLLLEETTKAERAKLDAHASSAMVVKASTVSMSSLSQEPDQSTKTSTGGRRQIYQQRGGRGNNSGGHRRSGNSCRNSGNSGGRGFQQLPWGGWYPYSHQLPPWRPPPCPYPTWGAWPPPSMPRQQGILGPRPSQSFYTTASSTNDYAPTDIDQAMHTLSLKQLEEHWFMDSAATSHMTANPGLSVGEPSAEI